MSKTEGTTVTPDNIAVVAARVALRHQLARMTPEQLHATIVEEMSALFDVAPSPAGDVKPFGDISEAMTALASFVERRRGEDASDLQTAYTDGLNAAATFIAGRGVDDAPLAHPVYSLFQEWNISEGPEPDYDMATSEGVFRADGPWKHHRGSIFRRPVRPPRRPWEPGMTQVYDTAKMRGEPPIPVGYSAGEWVGYPGKDIKWRALTKNPASEGRAETETPRAKFSPPEMYSDFFGGEKPIFALLIVKPLGSESECAVCVGTRDFAESITVTIASHGASYGKREDMCRVLSLRRYLDELARRREEM
jgi:hypothetical protein